ncbi:hypothetical protein RRF57_011057 [Xylaria bambusicola]|uniref:Uncharacterized protein n=1 Tax=Xylaria bambusicola TaxID=326684 RepID=A0AAN7Z3B0_9PEZI
MAQKSPGTSPRKCVPSLRSLHHHGSECVLSILQLFDPILEEVSQVLHRKWFRCNGLDFDIRHSVDDEGRKDVLKTPDNMAFDNLSGDVGGESRLELLYLRHSD